MKVRKLLQLQSEIEERKVPCDLCDDELNQHYSQSKDEFINILDMGKISNKELLGQQISIIERAVRIIEQQL